MASLAFTAAPLPSLRSRTAVSKSLLLKPSPRLQAQTRPGPLRTAALGFNKTLSPLIAFPKLADSAARDFAPLRSRGLTVKAAAATTGGGSITPAKQPWQGEAMKPLFASIATGVILWFVPTPAGVTKNAWQLLAIFLATIVGIITQYLLLGVVALLGLGASMLTKTSTFTTVFSAFGDLIQWIISLTFF